jgi:hypothetical protein
MPTPENSQDTFETSGDPITLADYVVPSGANKKLFVNITADCLDDPGDTFTCTFDGNAMTNLGSVESNVYSSYTARTTLFSYDLGSSTPTGDIVGTPSGSNNVKSMLHAYVVPDLAQQAPEATETTFKDGFDDDFVTDDITTITEDAYIVSAAHGDSPSQIDVTGSGHTLILAVNDDDTGLGSGYLNATSITSYTMGYDGGEGTGWGQILCAFELFVASVTRDQDKFRVYDEDGVALAAEDATPDIAVDVPFVPVANIQMSGDPPAESPTWYYRKVGDADSELEKLAE